MQTSRSFFTLLGLLGCLTAAAPVAAEPAVLRGKAVFLEPLDSANLTILELGDAHGSQGRPLQFARFRNLYNGVFQVPLDEDVSEACSAICISTLRSPAGA